MRFNELKPAAGSKRARKRLGRGGASGTGKTGGRGVKGQKSRSGVSIKPGFEGGQMPIHRRLPKFGFLSRTGRYTDQVRLGALARLDAEVVDLDAVKAAGLVDKRARRVKVIAHGGVDRALSVRGLAVTRGARAAIEAAGGSVEDAGPAES